MYIPPWFHEENVSVLHELMRRYHFATLVTVSDGCPFASHLPFLVDTHPAPLGTLRAHVARPNPQWKHFQADQEVLVIFQGPHAYISPALYDVQPAVPTWNYAVVHAYGMPRIQDSRALYQTLKDLVSLHEPHPEALDMPEPYVRRQLDAIVGVEIALTRLEGKFKLSQNRQEGDQRNVIAAGHAEADPGFQDLASLMDTRQSKR